MENQKESNKPRLRRTRIKCLFLDYDGTIGPLNVPREQSRVPEKMFSRLEQISRLIPIVIVSTKDLPFLVPRTPFAHAWCGIAGIERKVGDEIEHSSSLEDTLGRIAGALNYAKSTLNGSDFFLEEKHDSRGRTVAFCVDWRHAKDVEMANHQAGLIKNRCIELSLEVLDYAGQPFFDVYPIPIDKGEAVKDIREKLTLKDGTLYMGDSEIDNSAFRACDTSLGVINEENNGKNLDCDFLMAYGEVERFLVMLLENHLFFDSDFPMIQTNPSRV